MKHYNIPSISTVLSVASAWLAGIAVLSVASVSSTASVAELALRLALTIGLAVGSLLSFRAALNSQRSGADEEFRREVESALSSGWSTREAATGDASRSRPIGPRDETAGKARAA